MHDARAIDSSCEISRAACSAIGSGSQTCTILGLHHMRQSVLTYNHGNANVTKEEPNPGVALVLDGTGKVVEGTL